MRPCPTLLLCLTLLACGGDAVAPAPAPDPGPAAPDALPPLPAGAHALATLDPAAPPDDLAPLGPLLAGVELVGLGESVHTSGGFQRAKARLVRHLVEREGVRLVALETPRTDAEATARYVAGEDVPLRSALESIFPVFADTHMRDLLGWLRAWNAAHPQDPVRFFGFDVQQPMADLAELRLFLEAAAPSDAPALLDGLARCLRYGHGVPRPAEYSSDDSAACTAGLDALDAYLTDREPALRGAAPGTALDLARVAAGSLRASQGQEYFRGRDALASYDARDAGMASTLLALRALRAPGARTAVWAHNAHLAHDTTRVEGAQWSGARMMGTRLRAALGARYAAIGLVAFDLHIAWPGVGFGPATENAPDSAEARLDALGRRQLLVDLAQPVLPPGQAMPLGWHTQVPAEQFRALVFLAYSPGMASAL